MIPALTHQWDLYTVFVYYVAGNFFLATLLLLGIMFVILGPLGRCSIYSTMQILGIFLLAMCLGYGIVSLNIAITLFLLISFLWSGKQWLDTHS